MSESEDARDLLAHVEAVSDGQRRRVREKELRHRVWEGEDYFEFLTFDLEPRAARLVRVRRLELVRDLMALVQFARDHDERMELLARAQVHAVMVNAVSV